MISEISDDSAVIIVAAGRGVRYGGNKKKQYSLLAGHTVLVWSIFAFIRAGYDKNIIVVTESEEIAFIKNEILGAYSFRDLVKFTSGGSSRQRSVYKGINCLPTEVKWVAIHDAARPLVTVETIRSVFQSAVAHGASLVAIPATDSTFTATDMKVDSYLDRGTLWQAQTPQIFRKEAIVEAHQNAQSDKFLSNDDAALYRKYKGDVMIVKGDTSNMKITYPYDLTIAEKIINEDREYPQ